MCDLPQSHPMNSSENPSKSPLYVLVSKNFFPGHLFLPLLLSLIRPLPLLLLWRHKLHTAHRSPRLATPPPPSPLPFRHSTLPTLLLPHLNQFLLFVPPPLPFLLPLFPPLPPHLPLPRLLLLPIRLPHPSPPLLLFRSQAVKQ